MRSRERFVRKLLSQLHNLNANDNRGLVLLLAMLKKTGPLETLLATAPPHNDLLSKAESSTRISSRWTRNSCAVGVQSLHQDGRRQQQEGRSNSGGGGGRGGNSVSSSMAHKRYKRPRSNLIVVNPVNMQASMQWANLPPHLQQNPPPSFLLHRSLSDTVVFPHTSPSNVCFRRNASSGEFSGGNRPAAVKKNRK